MWFPLSFKANAVALIAQLSDSLPPHVKYISLDLAPINWAIVSLELSTAALASCAKLYTADGFA